VKRALLLMLALGACAKAGAGQPAGDDQPPPDAPNPPIDAPDDPDAPIDAPPIDAGPTTVTLTQTPTPTISTTASFACYDSVSTREASWYRVYRLADAGIVGGMHVTAVTFGVSSSSGLVPVQIKVGTYAGTLSPYPAQLNTSQITPLASASFTVPNTDGTPTTATVPISANVPALGQLIIEIYAPTLETTGKRFFLGATTSPETEPGYLRAPDCGATSPRQAPSFSNPTADPPTNFDNSHFIIDVTGTY
jgi:hypothetical protein